MDPAYAAGQHRIDDSNFIKYEAPLPNKVKYTPPSPTTSGYSESGSEMDNHDSGRVSEMENSPKMGPRRPNTISLGRNSFIPVDAQANSPEPFSEGKNTIRNNSTSDQTRHLNKTLSDDYAMPVDAYDQNRRSIPRSHRGSNTITVSTETLRTLVLCIQDARSRLTDVEGRVDGLVRALQLQHGNSNNALITLSKAMVSLRKDCLKAGQGLQNGRVPKQFQPFLQDDTCAGVRQHSPCVKQGVNKVPFSSNNNNVKRPICSDSTWFQSTECIGHTRQPASSTLPAYADYQTATFPRFLRGEQSSFTPMSVAPPADKDGECYDNVTDIAAKPREPRASQKKIPSEAEAVGYVNDDVIRASSLASFENTTEDPQRPRPRSPVYAVVQKKNKLGSQDSSVEDVTSPVENGTASQSDDVSEHTMLNEAEDDIEKIMQEMAESARKVLTTDQETSGDGKCRSEEEIWQLTHAREEYDNQSYNGADSKASEFLSSVENLNLKGPVQQHGNSHSRDTSKCSHQSQSSLLEGDPDKDKRARFPEPAANNGRKWHELEQNMTVSSVPNIQRATVLQPCDKKPNLMRGKSVDSIRESTSKSNSSIDTVSTTQKGKKGKKKPSTPKAADEKKSNIFSSYRWFKRKGKHKTKRSVSQNSFTFVRSPLHDDDDSVPDGLSSSPASSRRFKSVESALSDRSGRISQDMTTISSLSNFSSSFEGSIELQSATPQRRHSRTPSGDKRKSSSRSIAGCSSANAQLYRLQSREELFIAEDNSSVGEFDNVSHLETLERKSRSRECKPSVDEPEGEEMRGNIAKLAKKAFGNGPAVERRAEPEEGTDKGADRLKKENDIPLAEERLFGRQTPDENYEDDVFVPHGVILERQQHEQAERIRFEGGHVRAPDEPPPKPNRPGLGRGAAQGSPRSSVNAHGSSNGAVPGYSGRTPAVPPKSKIMTPEELTNHEAQEKLRMKQMEEAMLQQRLNQQQEEAEKNARWLQQEEHMLNPGKSAANGDEPGMTRSRGSSNSLTDMQAPPPPSVAPSKPPRKTSRPKDEPSGPPQTKIQLEEVKTAPTMQLNRDGDQVYKDTMEVVKAVLSMNNMTMTAKPEELFASVKGVGAALKQLCTSLDKTLPSLPEAFHREIDMAQKTTNKDLSQVINQLKLVQRFYTTTQVVDYKKCLMAANQVLAIDAKNLLDVVDRARIRKIQSAQEAEARARAAKDNDVRHGAGWAPAAYEPEDLYPADDVS